MMKKLKRKISAFIVTALSAVIFAQTAFASSAAAGGAFGRSKIATGTTKLLNDVFTWLQILIAVVGVVCFVYFMIRRSAADEQDQKGWGKRAITAIISTVLGELAAAIINLVLSYYK